MRRRGLLLAAGLAVVVVGLGLAAPASDPWFAASLWARDAAMGHGPAAQPGVLDAGDLANYVRHPTRDEVLTHVEARLAEGRAMGGAWGDIVAYRPGGKSSFEPGGQPVLRRALVWVEYNATSERFDVPVLGLWSVGAVTIPHVGSPDPERGWVVRDLVVPLVQRTLDGLAYPAGQHSGWVTKADGHAAADQQAVEGRAAAALVQPAWLEARVVRVVDAEAMVVPMALAIAAAVVAGVVGLLFRDRWMGILRSGGRGAAGALRAACECGAAWAELAFCARCGAERAPARRYTPDALAAARAGRPQRRR